jgi:hypothetical protein
MIPTKVHGRETERGKPKMHGGKRIGSGRKPTPPETHVRQMNITLSPYHADYLRTMKEEGHPLRRTVEEALDILIAIENLSDLEHEALGGVLNRLAGKRLVPVCPISADGIRLTPYIILCSEAQANAARKEDLI